MHRELVHEQGVRRLQLRAVWPFQPRHQAPLGQHQRHHQRTARPAARHRQRSSPSRPRTPAWCARANSVISAGASDASDAGRTHQPASARRPQPQRSPPPPGSLRQLIGLQPKQSRARRRWGPGSCAGNNDVIPRSVATPAGAHVRGSKSCLAGQASIAGACCHPGGALQQTADLTDRRNSHRISTCRVTKTRRSRISRAELAPKLHRQKIAGASRFIIQESGCFCVLITSRNSIP